MTAHIEQLREGRGVGQGTWSYRDYRLGNMTDGQSGMCAYRTSRKLSSILDSSIEDRSTELSLRDLYVRKNISSP